MVEQWNKQYQLNSDQEPVSASEKDLLVLQNREDLSSFTSIVSPNTVKFYNVKERPVAENGMQVYELQIGQDKKVITSHEDVKVNEVRKYSVTCTYQKEKVGGLNGGESEDFTIVKKIGDIEAQICRMDASTETAAEPIILICQKADHFGGPLSSRGDNDSLSAASGSPIFSIDQDLAHWSILWDLPSEPGALKQLNGESLQLLPNGRSRLKLINRLETWSAGLKKKFRSQFHLLTQKVKPKGRSPDQMKSEEDDYQWEGHIQDDGFIDIPLS